MSDKSSYTGRIRQEAGDVMRAAENLAVLASVYFDRGYNVGGTDPITDPDITESGITAIELAAVITSVEQLNNYLDNQAVVQADHSANYNKARRIENL